MTSIHDAVTTTFTFTCPWGCEVSVIRGVEQPHACDGTSRLLDLMHAGAIDSGQTYLEIAERLARGLDGAVRLLASQAWETGLRDGRSGEKFVGIDTEATS